MAAGVAAGVVIGAAVAPAGAQGPGPGRGPGPVSQDEFVQTNLVSNLSNQGAQITDPDLKNPWGVTMGPATPLWVSDNNAGVSTLYSIAPGGTSVTKAPRTVNIPGGRPSTGDGPSPTGQVFNPTSGFVVTGTSGSGPALFIFDSESGQLSGWSPAADPFSPDMATAELKPGRTPTAVYKGLAIATDADGTFLYASNFHDGTVDVFNDQWQPVTMPPGSFTDPSLPPGYAPFGIQVLDDLVYVSYARQDATKHDDVAGEGHGFIDIYTLNGFLVERLASRGTLNSPWGMEIAPAGFGRFAGDLLVGNFGDGRINVFDPFAPQRFRGQLRDEHHQAISVDGLWALRGGHEHDGRYWNRPLHRRDQRRTGRPAGVHQPGRVTRCEQASVQATLRVVPWALMCDNPAVEAVDYTNTFIACSDDCPAAADLIPAGAESVATRTWQMIAGYPYRYTSGDVIFEVYADRHGVPSEQRAAARRDFYSKPRACLRSSDLGKRYGWGIHADAAGRLAAVGRETPEYATLASGQDCRGGAVKVVKAMRSSRK